MSGLADFDRFCDERGIHDPKDYAAAFADWLAQETGGPVVGGPVGEPPAVVAVPDTERRDG